jgi:RNA polymerase sigma-70 factor (ECF subfamily)
MMNSDGPPGGLAKTPETDPAHLESLYLQHERELWQFVRGVAGDAATADDVVQATFLKVQAQGRAVDPASFKPWLFKVALHEALAVRRRRTAQERAHEGWRQLARPSPGEPGDALQRKELVESVRRAIEELPIEQRKVLLLRMDEGRSFADIARTIGAPLGTVLTRMRLALEKLRASLNERDVSQ